jgi:Integrase core domain
MGLRDRPITPRSPWQNGHVERLIGSIRRECHVVVFGDSHLRYLSASYCACCNGARTHLALDRCRVSGESHQSPGSAVPIDSTFGWHNR